MVRHIILWQIKEEYSEEQKQKIRMDAKKALEDLKGKVPGLVDIHIQAEKLDSSNADLMLNATLETEEALKGYAVHPDHVKAANTFVRPFMQVRMCMDYME